MDRSAEITVSRSTGAAGLVASVRIYLELAKARLATLVVLTTAVGYLLGARGQGSVWGLLWTLIGTALTAFGANILNQCREVERDARMERTRARPLPSGQISRSRAVRWGVWSAFLGLGVLAAGSNWLTAGLALGVIALYVLVYTPLKVTTPLNTLVGAVCGAIPPMMGWTAASGELEMGAWILFGILYLWQIPHFLALAWIYRDDYARGGFRMLPALDRQGTIVGRVVTINALALLPVCAAASAAGLAGVAFLLGSLALTVAFAVVAWTLSCHRTVQAARRLFLASLLYLPLVLGLMVVG
jgi:protoheme IX farnesyltransferase